MNNDQKPMTDAIARERVVGYLQKTVDALPWSAVLANQLPGYETSLDAGPRPADTDDGNPQQPYKWEFSLWYIPSDDKPPTDMKDAVITIWRQWGCDIDKKEDGTIYARTQPDHFVLVMQFSVQGHLSLTAWSPSFPKSQLDRAAPWPTRITKTADTSPEK